MREPSPQALRDRFAYMFRYGYGEFYFARGWLQILFSASQKIDAVLGDDKRGFHWIQLAEKLGAKGFDYHLDRACERDAVAVAVRAIADRAAVASKTACVVCGAPAECRQHKDYFLMLCAAPCSSGLQDDTGTSSPFGTWMHDKGDDDV